MNKLWKRMPYCRI